jgi:hypothetical protein
MRKGGRRNGGLEVIALADGLKVFIPGWKHRSCRSYLKEGSQVHVCNRPICGGGRLLFLLGVPVSGHFGSRDFWLQ